VVRILRINALTVAAQDISAKKVLITGSVMNAGENLTIRLRTEFAIVAEKSLRSRRGNLNQQRNNMNYEYGRELREERRRWAQRRRIELFETVALLFFCVCALALCLAVFVMMGLELTK